MCHTPSSSPDDEPTEDFVIWDNIAWFKPTKEQAEIIKQVIGLDAESPYPETIPGGTYNKMIHRETDGPDPLVQEPKGKP